MTEVGEAVHDAIEWVGESRLNSIVALLVALAATFSALTSLKDRNISLDMTQMSAKAVDTWNFYQAKSTKQNLAESTLDEIATLKTVSSGGAAIVAQLDKRIEDYHDQIDRYEHEKAEIKQEAEGYEHRYEALNRRHEQFDLSEAAMSVAIAVLGVTALTKKRALLTVAAVFLLIGVIFGMAGFLNLNLHANALLSWLS
jgi:chromosome segregation ATPase